MKIQCEQCKIEYTIDDASIGERGIRAQCPRCNHITTIRKSQSAIMDQARAKLDSAICVNCGKPCEPSPNDPIPMCASCQALGQEATGAKTTVSGQQMPPAGNTAMGPNPLAGLPGFNNPIGPVPGFGQAPPPLPGFGTTDPGLSAMPGFGVGAPAKNESGNIPAPPVYAPQADDGRSWRIKKSPSGEIYGPFDRDLITGWIDSDKIVPADEICRVGGPWRAAAEHEDFKEMFAARYKLAPGAPARVATPTGTAVSAPATTEGAEELGVEGEPPSGAPSGPPTGKAGDIKTSKGGAMAIAAGRLGARPSASRGIPRGALFAIGGVLLAGVLAIGVVTSGVVGKVKHGLQATPTPLADEGTDKQIAAFAHDFPNVTGTSDEHVKAGREAMALDTVVGWQTARKEFAMALAVQKSNLDALAGVAEADALLGQYDDQTSYLKEALELATRAVDRSPDSPDANRAKAAGLLASGSPVNYPDARTMLTDKVLVKSSSDAIATAMLGRSWRGFDDAKAEELLRKAVTMGPGLVRPKLELGLLYESQNRYQKALETFKTIAPRSYLAAYHTGVIAEKVGRYKEAVSAYDAAAKVALADGGGRSWVEALVASAVIQYQALDNARAATQALAPIEAKLASGEIKLKPELESRYKLHRAILYRLQGGAEAFEKSLALSNQIDALRVPEFAPAAHFNAGLVKLRKSDFDGANRELEEADIGGLPDRVKSEIYFWQAHLKQRQGDSGSAGQKYEDSEKEDPQNWRPVVAHAAMMGEATDQEVGALDKMQDLARLDPEFYESYQRVTIFFPDPSSELLSKAERVFGKLYGSHSTDPRAATALGMIAFLQKNSAKARNQINAALSEAEPDRGALVYSGLLLEQKGGTENLKTAIDRYSQVKTNAPSAFLSMAIGRCLLKLGKLDDAHAALTESLQLTPYYPPAQYWMGVELQKHGDKKAALAKWSEALRYDPNYLRASQAIAEAGDS